MRTTPVPVHPILALQHAAGNAAVVQRMMREDEDEDLDDRTREKQGRIDAAVRELSGNKDLQRARKSGFNPSWTKLVFAHLKGVKTPWPKGHTTGGTGKGGTQDHEDRHGKAARILGEMYTDAEVKDYFKGFAAPAPAWWTGEAAVSASSSSSSSSKALRHDEKTEKEVAAEKAKEKADRQKAKGDLHEYWAINLAEDVEWPVFREYCRARPKGPRHAAAVKAWLAEKVAKDPKGKGKGK